MAGVELPVIVGSQSLYGVTPHVPDIVKRSVECGFILLAAGPSAFRAVIEQIGFASSFQETHGYYHRSFAARQTRRGEAYGLGARHDDADHRQTI